MGRPDGDEIRGHAMNLLGNGLHEVGHHEDELSAREAELSTLRRLGGTEAELLGVLGNLALTYEELGRPEALQMKQDVYNGNLKLNGEEHGNTLMAASNYTNLLLDLRRFEEARSLLRKMIPVARRALGEGAVNTLRMRWIYARAIYLDASATLNDLHESVETLESVARVWIRVFGEAHPETPKAQDALKIARGALAARRAASAGYA